MSYNNHATYMHFNTPRGLVWYQSIGGLSEYYPDQSLNPFFFAKGTFGNRVLGRNNPHTSPENPIPDPNCEAFFLNAIHYLDHVYYHVPVQNLAIGATQATSESG
jgi:hypothetical protein